MIDPHLVKSIDKDSSCIYCSNKLDKKKWFSKFFASAHYKCVPCSCGKLNCVDAGFIGTGHDSWSGLEEKVVDSSSVKVVKKDVRIIK